MNLQDLGWNNTYAKHLQKKELNTYSIGRISHHSGKHYKILTQDGEQNALLSNSFIHTITKKSDIPTVGDWVGLEKNPEINTYHIRLVFPRKNKISRKAAGKKSEEQLIAANIDTVFIMTSADSDFNLRRLERYLIMVYEIQAQPVIILNKIDKIQTVEQYQNKIAKICHNTPLLAISAQKGYHIDNVKPYIQRGKTIVLVGSSGVGKSTLINTLLGYSRQSVGETRASDDKGRHITSTREMIILPQGGIIIDNPGIRELQLWSSGDGIAYIFSDIEELSTQCNFSDCHHDKEPGCAVQHAIKEGKLSIERLHSYHKLLRENEYLNRRRNIYEKRKRDRQLGKMYRKADSIRRYKEKE